MTGDPDRRNNHGRNHSGELFGRRIFVRPAIMARRRGCIYAPLLFSNTMAVVTTVGPLREQTRDRLKAYRDRDDHPNYDAALQALLEDAGVDKN
jgi:hypothetical protein